MQDDHQNRRKSYHGPFKKEYTEVLDLEYVGFSGETMISIFAHLRTWYTITDDDQDAAEDSFRAPWSEFPNTHLKTYARRLTRLQNEAVYVDLVITDATKRPREICASKRSFRDKISGSVRRRG